MSGCRLAKISISPGVANSLIAYEDHNEKSSIVWYQLAVRAFMRPAMHFCKDLAYWMGVLSRFCSYPGPTHVELVK